MTSVERTLFPAFRSCLRESASFRLQIQESFIFLKKEQMFEKRLDMRYNSVETKRKARKKTGLERWERR